MRAFYSIALSLCFYGLSSSQSLGMDADNGADSRTPYGLSSSQSLRMDIGDGGENNPSKNEISLLYRKCFEQDLENKCRSIKYLSSLLGFGAGVPYMASSLKAGEYYGSRILGYYFCTSTILFSGGISAWAIWELLEDCDIETSSTRCNPKLGKALGSVVLGALSSIPQVYIAYKYNAVKEIAAVSFVYEGVIRALGFNKAIGGIKRAVLKCKTSPDLKIRENKALEVIETSQAGLIALRRYDLPLNEELQRLSVSKDIYSYLSDPLTLTDTNITLPQHYASGIPRRFVQYAALIFPTGGAFVNFILAYKGINLLIENHVAVSLLSVISISPTFILDSYATKKIAGSCFDVLYNIKNNQNRIDLDYFESFYPKTKKIMLASAFIFAASSTMASAYVALDNLEDTFLDSGKYFFMSLTAITAVKLGSFGIAQTLLNFGGAFLGKFKKSASYTYTCLKKLSALKERIRNTNPVVVHEFLAEVQ